MITAETSDGIRFRGCLAKDALKEMRPRGEDQCHECDRECFHSSHHGTKAVSIYLSSTMSRLKIPRSDFRGNKYSHDFWTRALGKYLGVPSVLATHCASACTPYEYTYILCGLTR